MRKSVASARHSSSVSNESCIVTDGNRQLIRIAAAVVIAVCSSARLSSPESKFQPRLQEAADRSMDGRAGAVVVADVASGALVAAHGLDAAAHQTQRPGSTLKPFVLMALLESGKLDASQRLLCRRPLRIGGVRMDCRHQRTLLDFNAEEAVTYSCNSYFADVAARLNGTELVETLRRAGLDSPSGLVKEEASGHIARPDDRDMLQLEALGDRGVEVTTLELLGAYRKLALQRRNRNVGVDEPVFAGLEQSVVYGMAHAANVEGMKIAGKTGTAASPGSAGTHGFFLGYAPAGKPEIVLAVYLERGRGAEAAAIAQPVLTEFARERLAP